MNDDLMMERYILSLKMQNEERKLKLRISHPESREWYPRIKLTLVEKEILTNFLQKIKNDEESNLSNLLDELEWPMNKLTEKTIKNFLKKESGGIIR